MPKPATTCPLTGTHRQVVLILVHILLRYPEGVVIYVHTHHVQGTQHGGPDGQHRLQQGQAAGSMQKGEQWLAAGSMQKGEQWLAAGSMQKGERWLAAGSMQKGSGGWRWGMLVGIGGSTGGQGGSRQAAGGRKVTRPRLLPAAAKL
jgi:hypothetical protein